MLLLKSHSKKPGGSLKEILLIYYFYFCDEGCENKFIFENFDCGTKVNHFMDLIRGVRKLTQI